MTDKVQKIRNEVEKLKSNLMYGACSSQVAMETRCKEEAYNEVLAILDTMQEEPVSEDLEEAAIQFATDTKTGKVDVVKQSSFLWGAIYHKQQMEAYRIKHCKSLTNEQAELEETFVSSHVEKNNRIPTFIDAIEYGMEYCKQKMMAKAVKVKISNSSIISLPSDCDLKVGDKYKVILIKEDRK